jgi:colanic acid biosynthesis glycosyl transferase WcaI
MRILLVTQRYLPEPWRLVSELAEALHAAHHEVTVLTGFPNFPDGRLYPGYGLRLYQRETIHGVPVLRVPLYPNHGTSALKRILNYLSFAASVALLAPWLAPKVDIVHVVDPPYNGPSTWFLSRLLRARLTAEVQDLWPDLFRAAQMLSNPFALMTMNWCAKWMYRRCAAIRVISAGFRENLLQKGIAAHTLYTIPNWVDTDFYRPQDPNTALAEELGLAGRFNILYTGNMGKAQSLEGLLDAAALLQNLPEAQFVLVGFGSQWERLRELVERRGLKNVKVRNRVPEEQMSLLLGLADVLLVRLRDEPALNITIPHKIYAYMASGKPILATITGETADLVRSTRAGMVCHPNDVTATVSAVRRFYAMSASERQEMGEHGRRAACSLFSQSHLLDQIIAMFRAVTHSRDGKRREDKQEKKAGNNL